MGCLASFETCVEGKHEWSCEVFKDNHASTISMTVLVLVEMFNALNALSENGSLLQLPPWTNMWLIGGISLSMLLHVMILYTPALAPVFSVVPLTAYEWKAVVFLSFPVILVDEALKFVTRNFMMYPGQSNIIQRASLLYRGLVKRKQQDASKLKDASLKV